MADHVQLGYLSFNSDARFPLNRAHFPLVSVVQPKYPGRAALGVRERGRS